MTNGKPTAIIAMHDQMQKEMAEEILSSTYKITTVNNLNELEQAVTTNPNVMMFDTNFQTGRKPTALEYVIAHQNPTTNYLGITADVKLKEQCEKMSKNHDNITIIDKGREVVPKLYELVNKYSNNQPK